MYYNILNISVIIILVVNHTKTVMGNETCNCIPMKQCSSFLKYFKGLERPLSEASKEHLKSKQCEDFDGQVKVCCDFESTTAPTRTHHSRSSYKKQCYTSQCMMLKRCPSFMQFIAGVEKPLTPVVVDFLRSQQCGFEEGFPMVCCRELPRNLRIHSNHRRKSIPIKPLSVNIDEEDDKLYIYQNLVQKTDRTTTPMIESTTQKVLEDRRKKYERFNKAFYSSYDYDEFDLILRQIRSVDSNSNEELEIEIR
ncbi:uncharacterized protein LOC114339160 [Diabrotica virgifera virgifera]|uniref:Uncharacterized protein LOC114339160 n=1 Tax=Diabrotica virgifera virgifera TaxID=50390 RepID=A0A6P7GK54_DIAVI|nr:uncharacterized protein LOC114339160 [Diabrotica virgifera virgifera]